MASKTECLRNDVPERAAPGDGAASPGARDVAALELVPPPAPECDCRSALRRLLAARDRYLVALGDGTAPFKLPEEDEYLEALASARDLVAKG